MDSGRDTLAGGLPHSEISGSMLVCQLPGAFRRLPRLSSPVVAKASTACAWSLDPPTPTRVGPGWRVAPRRSRGAPPRGQMTARASFLLVALPTLLKSVPPVETGGSGVGPIPQAAPRGGGFRYRVGSSGRGGGARRARTADPRLAKPALSRLSYGPTVWWVWVDSNHRPHPYQGCALTA